MTDALPLLDEPASGLMYRLRRAQPQPVARLLLLHGVGGNETNLVSAADAIDPRIEIAFVRGPLAAGPAQHAWFPVRFGPRGPEIDGANAEASRVKLLTMIRALHERDGASPLPTVIAGFSQGGIMSASVGLSSPRDVVGFAVLSGRILPELDPLIAARDELGALHALIAHGRLDDTLPVSWAETADAKLAALGVPHETRLYPVGHALSAEMIGDFAHWLGERVCLS
jgi:phospholipase/carboxylesterase